MPVKKTVTSPEGAAPQIDFAAELAKMKAELEAQYEAKIEAFREVAESRGHTFQAPPNEINVERESDPQPYLTKAEREGRPKPGSTIGTGINAPWVPWSRQDLDLDDVVTFTPEPVLSIMHALTDDKGRRKMYLNVNGLECWLTLNAENKINRFFYHAYMDRLQAQNELEALKRDGPVGMSWGATTSDGKKTWLHLPGAETFGITPDGHNYTPERQERESKGQ